MSTSPSTSTYDINKNNNNNIVTFSKKFRATKSFCSYYNKNNRLYGLRQIAMTTNFW